MRDRPRLPSHSRVPRYAREGPTEVCWILSPIMAPDTGGRWVSTGPPAFLDARAATFAADTTEVVVLVGRP